MIARKDHGNFNRKSQGLWVGHPPFCDFLYRARGTLRRSELDRREDFMIAIGSDHGGVELKDFLVGVLYAMGIEVRDCGTQGKASVDYPDFGREVSMRVASGEADRGILVCTSGIGMSITANKFPAVRAALVHDLETARSSRQHNNANILVLSGARTEQPLAKQILEVWLATPFAGGRHQRRVDKISQVERDLGMQLNGQAKK